MNDMILLPWQEVAHKSNTIFCQKFARLTYEQHTSQNYNEFGSVERRITYERECDGPLTIYFARVSYDEQYLQIFLGTETKAKLWVDRILKDFGFTLVNDERTLVMI